ncbi:MAG: hypothetical protein H0X62_09060, partial [Bacteroidetes bacterium]|nr:hypothetical protein [Bacteroidota bacterium]
MKIFSQYKKLEKHIFYLIFAELFIQLINTSFLLIMLIFMQKSGYSDYESADFISYRFLGTLLLAFPLGLYIKGRAIKPFFLFGSFTVPIFSLLIVYGVYFHIYWLLYVSQILWGISFLFFQITALPYILRNARRDTHTEAISLTFATFSFGGILSGLLIYTLQNINPVLFDEMMVLQIISALGFISIFFITRIDIEEKIPEEPIKKINLREFDWNLIFKSLFPVMVISIGAGLTIPFIGIFFFNVHQVDSDEFAMFGSIAAIFVAIGAV